MQENARFELTLPAIPEAELVAASTAECIASINGFTDKEKAEIRLAVTETCVNLLYNSPCPIEHLKLMCTLRENRLLITIRAAERGLQASLPDAPRNSERRVTVPFGRCELVVFIPTDPGA